MALNLKSVPYFRPNLQTYDLNIAHLSTIACHAREERNYEI